MAKKEEKTFEENGSLKKSDFVSMAHDLRTPLNAIMGYATMAKKYIGDRNLVLEYLEKIELSGGQLLSLFNQVLGENAEESGIKEINSIDIDLTDRRILLVEDNYMNREIARDMLEDYGFIVEEASNGIEAVEMVSEAIAGFYDAVIMDIQMPKMDGYEATKKIRALPKKDIANVPIIALSANAFEEDEKKSIEAGMNAHIVKPIEIEKLINALNDCINK